MTSEMMPCPFCGGMPSKGATIPSGKGWRVQCFNMDCPIDVGSYGMTEQEAIAAWNTRPAPAGELAALAEAWVEAALTFNGARFHPNVQSGEPVAAARAAFHAALAAHLAEVRAAIGPLRALHVAQVAAWPASEQWDDRCSIMVDWPVVCRIAALAKKLEG